MELVDKELGCLLCIFCVEIQNTKHKYRYEQIMVEAFKRRGLTHRGNTKYEATHRLICIVLVSQAEVRRLYQVQVLVNIVQQILPGCFALKYGQIQK